MEATEAWELDAAAAVAWTETEETEAADWVAWAATEVTETEAWLAAATPTLIAALHLVNSAEKMAEGVSQLAIVSLVLLGVGKLTISALFGRNDEPE